MRGKIAVGLGYVGLPVVVAFSDKYQGTIGFNINSRRVAALRGGDDWTGEVSPFRLKASSLTLTNEIARIKGATPSVSLRLSIRTAAPIRDHYRGLRKASAR